MLSVNASGPAPLSYQWQFGSSLIAGASNSGLTLTNAQLSNSGGYSVIVSDGAGSVTSAVAVVSVLAPPSITTPPQSLTSLAGSNATFTVQAGGGAPFAYQWQFGNVNLANGGRISGALSSALTISGLMASDAGSYQVIVTNPVGAVTSPAAVLTVNGPPVIISQPASQIVATGTNAMFSVVAAGTAPLGYQWLFNGTNLVNGGQISGANSATFSVGGVQMANAGGYSVVITNFAGSVTSAVATLSLNGVPNCVMPPVNLVGWWTGDGSANDSVGGNNGILQGGATATASGLIAEAFNFDGANGFVEIPDSTAFHPTNLTIEAWVMFSSLDTPASGGSPAGDEYIVFKQNSQSGNFEGFDLSKARFSNGDGFRFLVTSVAGQSVEVDSVTRVTTGVWYHIAGVRGPNFTQIYVNGQLEAQAAVNFPQDYGNLPLYFGTSGESYWDHKLSGNLDEVSLYNRPLSASEIASIYAAGSAGKCKGAGVPTAPYITAQPAGKIVTVGNPVSLTVTAAGTAPLNYQWFKDGLKLFDGTNIAGSTTPTLMLAHAQLSDVGDYQVKVANAIGSTMSAVAALTTGTPPPNDNFAAGQAISGSSGSVSGYNFNATKEPGEPNHAGNPGGASVWYNWTAPSTSPVTFDTALSAFDTLLAVYTGSSVGGLTLIAANDNISTNNVHSRLTFTPVAGTVYHIAVDGANDAQGSLTLRWVQASVPLPDLSVVASAVNPEIVTNTFAASSCAVQEGLVQAGTRTLIRFSTQTENSGNADLYFGNPASNPLFVWAPCHAHYHFQNYMSYRLRNSNGKIAAIGLKVGFCILDVFRWNPNSAPNASYTCSNQGIQQGWGDLYDSSLDGQWIDITGLPPGNYTIELEANPQGIILESNYGNNLTTVPIAIGNPNAPPLNDNFANAQALLGGFASVPGNNVNATKETGEPNHAGNAGGHSVWYQWTALSTKSVTIDTIGSSFDTLLAVYTGNSLNALTLVASNDNLGPGTLQSRVNFSATAGTVYRIAVDGANGAKGNIILTLNQTIGNDNFAFCEFVGGVSGSVYGSNAGATKESGEPDHAGNAGGASIWYCWTAPINGQVTFDTIGSTFDTLLAVYTGSAVNALTPIASNDNIDAAGGDLQSRVTFNAIGLTMYHIAIDGFNGATGDTVLNWNLVSSGNGPLAIAQGGTLPAVKLF
ncbi:MAG TPA: immunoglobulin domain-containing protein, partial [Verrucomicrobiae bacterium]|nr:immunoglobulin domain-containing protein [Verrucomicrobiae bacterium]